MLKALIDIALSESDAEEVSHIKDVLLTHILERKSAASVLDTCPDEDSSSARHEIEYHQNKCHKGYEGAKAARMIIALAQSLLKDGSGMLEDFEHQTVKGLRGIYEVGGESGTHADTEMEVDE